MKFFVERLEPKALLVALDPISPGLSDELMDFCLSNPLANTNLCESTALLLGTFDQLDLLRKNFPLTDNQLVLEEYLKKYPQFTVQDIINSKTNPISAVHIQMVTERHSIFVEAVKPLVQNMNPARLALFKSIAAGQPYSILVLHGSVPPLDLPSRPNT